MEVHIDKNMGDMNPPSMALSIAINPTWKQTKDSNQLRI